MQKDLPRHIAESHKRVGRGNTYESKATDDDPMLVAPDPTDVNNENSRGSHVRLVGTSRLAAMASDPEGYVRECSSGVMVLGEPHSRGWSAPMAI
jgi:hypothetical protein